MELFEMRQFLNTADCGSISEAAKELFISQPTLSHNIKKLENELDCQLFLRTHSGVQLTPSGKIVYDRTKRFFDEYNAMLEELNRQRLKESSALSIGCFAYGTASFLVPFMSAVMPDIEMAVTCCGNAELYQGLLEGEFDVVIADERLVGEGVACQNLYTERAFLSVPRKSEMAQRKEVTASDLVQNHFVINDDIGFGGWYRDILTKAGVPSKNINTVPFREYLQQKDLMPEFSLITSFIMNYVRVSDIRTIVPINEPYATRRIGLLTLVKASDKAKDFCMTVKRLAPFILSGNASASFALFANEGGSFTISTR